MTTQTYENASIMCYKASAFGHNTNVILPCWSSDFIIALLLDTGASGGIHKFDIDPGGDVINSRTAADIGIHQVAASSGGAATLSYDGTHLVIISHSANVVEIARIRTSDLTLLNTFGTAGSGLFLTQSDASNLLAPDKFVGVLHGGVSNLFTGGGATTGADGELCKFDIAGGMSVNTRIGQTTQHSLFCLSLSNHNETSGAMYALASPWRPGVGGAGSLGLYSVTSGSFSNIGTIAPSAIDATWTTMLNHAGLLLDETDGHVIAFVETNDSVTHKHYIVKINTSTAAVVWATAIANIPSTPWSMTNSRCKNQRFHYLRGSGTVDHIDTSTGTVTSTSTVAGMNATGSVALSDDVTNSIIFHGSFTEQVSGNPDFLGTYMGDGGHHTVSSQWFRYWFPTVGGGGDDGTGGRQGGLALSDQRAWTYTLDEHSFYVVDLGAEGTHALDTTTGQWAQVQSANTDGRWHATHGLNWGTTRIVVGDLTTNDVWVLSAEALLDRDVDPITRVVTGEIVLRTRDCVTCGAVRLACSVGDLGGDTATVRLRWSDDNGKTWSAYQSVTLEADDNAAEVQWLSLGSFGAPGRIFEISDIGGPIRIDGCDVLIPELDNASSS